MTRISSLLQSISGKLALTIGSLMAILAVAVVAAIIGSRAGYHLVDEYQSASTQSLAFEQLSSEISPMLVNALKYRITGEETYLEAVEQAVDAFNQHASVVSDALVDDARRASMQAAVTEMQALIASLNEAVGYQAERGTQVAELNAIGPQARRDVSAIIDGEFGAISNTAALALSKANTSLLLGR